KTIDDMVRILNGTTDPTSKAKIQIDQLSNNVCPAYTDLINNGTCGDTLVNKYKQDYWYVNGCMPLQCNTNKTNLTNAINIYNNAVRYNSAYGNASSMTRSICPLYPLINQTCDPT